MTILLIAGLALGVTSLLAAVLARGITWPVHQLVRGAQEIGQGHLDYRIAVGAGDELGRLAGAFNEMAADLGRAQAELRGWAAELERRVQAQTETIRAAEERLRTVVTNAPIVLWASDREGKFTLSEGKGLEPQGLKPGELVGRSVFEIYRDVPAIPADNRRALAGESFTATVEVAGLVFETHYAPCGDAERSGHRCHRRFD